ncbi:hypothetical protein AMTR_s00073p00050630 [Amborella trichopoda]|uniref:Uncharacterized protein n=1 Tax=Amborella trichopoda TaxID=13333 RepID=W1NNJ4_AMBTC|nr:hypothetical protein AMTR_s00073p00050630 [Amborella trichopoda]
MPAQECIMVLSKTSDQYGDWASSVNFSGQLSVSLEPFLRRCFRWRNLMRTGNCLVLVVRGMVVRVGVLEEVLMVVVGLVVLHMGWVMSVELIIVLFLLAAHVVEVK